MLYCTFISQKKDFYAHQRKELNRHALVAQHSKVIIKTLIKAIYLKHQTMMYYHFFKIVISITF